MLYRKATHLQKISATSLVMLSGALEVVVEHSRMTDQAHLFGSFDVARSDDGAAPRTDDIECRF